MILKKIGVLSLAKIYGSLMAFMGFIVGLFVSFFSFLIPAPQGTVPLMSLGLASIILLPIFYGVLGFLAGGFTAWIYNLVAKHMGGLELEFDKK